MIPENWKIKITEKNRGVLGKWRTKNHLSSIEGWLVSFYNNAKGFYFSSNVPKEFSHEISFEEFKQYVLGEIPPENYSIY